MLRLTELESHFDGDIIELFRFIKEYYIESREIESE